MSGRSVSVLFLLSVFCINNMNFIIYKVSIKEAEGQDTLVIVDTKQTLKTLKIPYSTGNLSLDHQN